MHCAEVALHWQAAWSFAVLQNLHSKGAVASDVQVKQ
jgi:hypothetical protein